MNTRLDTDPELLDLVRAADPMRDPRVQADTGLDTESALRLLAPELDRPPAPRPARHRRTALRIAVLAGVVAGAVFVVANVASTGNGSAVSSAQAQTILRHIRDALVWPAHAIYEEKDVTTVTARSGARFTSEEHAWLSTSAPYNNRLVRIWNGKLQWEQEEVNGRLHLYDPSTNTVYLAAGPPGNAVPDQPQWNSVLAFIQSLLAPSPPAASQGPYKWAQPVGAETSYQPHVTINSHAVLDGKPAIELTLDGGRFSYWISPSTYKPLQSVDRWDRLPDGQPGVGITRYPIVRMLTGSAASPNLLSLQAQHPHATVDHSSTDYESAIWRMGQEDRLLRRCSRSGCS